MNQLIAFLTGKKVAIVGNASLDRDYSKEIDEADVVCRFNHFYNVKDGHAGRKTDIIFQTFARPWFETPIEERNLDIIKEFKPLLYVVKKPEQFDNVARDFFSDNVRIEMMPVEAHKYYKYTTGGAVLCYLAEHLKNADVKIYGFPNGEQWEKYIATDAKHYASVASEERFIVDTAIMRLEALPKGERVNIPTHIVIPVKKASTGCPNKNKILLPILLQKLTHSPYDITVVTDDETLELPSHVERFLVPSIHPLADVTLTLRAWRDATCFCGDVCLLQCTSPNFKYEWLEEALEVRPRANVVVSAVKLNYKVNSIFVSRYNTGFRATMFGAPTIPRQVLPNAWRLSGALFLFHSDYLSRQSFFDDAEVTPIFVDEKDALDVDTIEQLNQLHS